MQGLIGKKAGMTSIFNDEGKNIPCTVIEAGPCVVTQIKTKEKDGYEVVQLGFDEKKEKRTSNPEKGHFKKANTTPKRKLVEFTGFGDEVKLGDTFDVELFNDDTWLDVRGITSLGASSDPSRVFKGMRMAGRHGGKQVMAISLRVMKIIPEENVLIVKGSVPGSNGSYLIITK